jgi:hypothetical protein
MSSAEQSALQTQVSRKAKVLCECRNAGSTLHPHSHVEPQALTKILVKKRSSKIEKRQALAKCRFTPGTTISYER